MKIPQNAGRKREKNALEYSDLVWNAFYARVVKDY